MAAIASALIYLPTTGPTDASGPSIWEPCVIGIAVVKRMTIDAVSFALMMIAAFTESIQHIGRMRAEKKMIRPHAARVVAFVKHAHIGRNLAVVNLP